MLWFAWSVELLGDVEFHGSYTTLCHRGIINHQESQYIIVIQFVIDWDVLWSTLFRCRTNLLQLFGLLLIARLNLSESNGSALWKEWWGLALFLHDYIVLRYFFSHIFEELGSSIFGDNITLGDITFFFCFLFWVFGSHDGGNTLLSCRLRFFLLVVDVWGILERSLFWSCWF